MSLLSMIRSVVGRVFPSAAMVAAAGFITAASAGQADEDFLQPEHYPAHIAAVNFGTGRMTAQDAVALDGWEVRLRPEIIVTWREIFGRDAIKPRRGIHIPAFCNRPSSAEREPCMLVVAERDGGSETFSHCDIAVFHREDHRYHFGRSDCPRSVEFGSPPVGQ